MNALPLNRTSLPFQPGPRLGVLTAVFILSFGLAGCANPLEDRSQAPASQTKASPGPLKVDGTRSTEFEEDDLRRADDASQSVKEYCAGAVSEAQRLGCESHVSESDIP